MTNLISDAQRVIFKKKIDDVHDTFSRTITVWRQSAQEITNTDQDYDAFGDNEPRSVVYTTESKDFKARIKYIDRQEKEFGIIIGEGRVQGTNIDVTQEFQLARIKVQSDANDYIKDCEKITIDGQDFSIITVPRPHGLFEPDYYTLYCKSLP